MPKIAQKMRKSLIKRMKKTKIITTLKNLHTRRGRWGNLFPSLLFLLLLQYMILESSSPLRGPPYTPPSLLDFFCVHLNYY